MKRIISLIAQAFVVILASSCVIAKSKKEFFSVFDYTNGVNNTISHGFKLEGDFPTFTPVKDPTRPEPVLLPDPKPEVITITKTQKEPPTPGVIYKPNDTRHIGEDSGRR